MDFKKESGETNLLLGTVIVLGLLCSAAVGFVGYLFFLVPAFQRDLQFLASLAQH